MSNHALKTLLPVNQYPKFDSKVAGKALVDGLIYLQSRLQWSGRKIALILHLSPNTVNAWLKNGFIPLNEKLIFPPDVQLIIHLLAIHRSLEAMFDPQHQRAWLSTFHPELKAVPEEMMASSMDGILFIRQYLDYARGRGA